MSEEKETPITIEQDSDSKDEEEQVTAEPNWRSIFVHR